MGSEDSNWLTLLTYPFMQRALLGGVLMGMLGGILGCFVTLRQLSFFSHTVGHGALVGIVFGVLLKLDPTWTLLPFCLGFGVLVLYLIEQTDLASDSIFSVAVSAALALGVILTGLIRGYQGNLMGVLFGDILAMNWLDLWLIFGLLLLSAVFLLTTMRQQILITLNVPVAQVQGISVRLHQYLFVGLLSLAVAVAIKAVGVLLVNAFLVIPAATSKLLTHHFYQFVGLSVVLGGFSSIVGMLVSGRFNVASGPTIVLVQFCLFVAVLLGQKLVR